MPLVTAASLGKSRSVFELMISWTKTCCRNEHDFRSEHEKTIRQSCEFDVNFAMSFLPTKKTRVEFPELNWRNYLFNHFIARCATLFSAQKLGIWGVSTYLVNVTNDTVPCPSCGDLWRFKLLWVISHRIHVWYIYMLTFGILMVNVTIYI